MTLRYAIVTDIHANWHALQAIVVDVAKENSHHPDEPYRFWFLGDIIGYGPHPIECLNWLRYKSRIDDRWVPGNHDVWLLEREGVNPDATESLTRHRNLLESDAHAETGEWFRKEMERALLPDPAKLKGNRETRSMVREQVADRTLLFVHASPMDTRRNTYLKPWTNGILSIAFTKIAKEVAPETNATLFCGHAHYPLYARRLPDEQVALQSIRYGCPLPIQPGLSIINPGSAGQPRDGDPRAAYALFDAGANTIEFRRVNYEINKSVDALKEGGYPDSLGKRLETGDGMSELAEFSGCYQRPKWDLEAINSPSPGTLPNLTTDRNRGRNDA